MNANQLASIGGLFAVFAFIHFFVDWILQTHAEAMAKHNTASVRAKHCLVYTLGFIPLLIWMGFGLWPFIIAVNILFWSHFIEDTYLPVYLWARYIRQPPEMKDDPKAGFIEFIKTPLGKILMIAVDQIIHLAFLFPVVWMALK